MNLNPSDSKTQIKPKIDSYLQLSMEAILWIYDGYFLALKGMEEGLFLFKSARVLAATKDEGEMEEIMDNFNIDEVDTFMWGNKHYGIISREELPDESYIRHRYIRKPTLSGSISKPWKFGIYHICDWLDNCKVFFSSSSKADKREYVLQQIRKTNERLRKKSEEKYFDRDTRNTPKPSIMESESLSLLDMAKKYYGYYVGVKNLTGNELSLDDCKGQIVGIAESANEMRESIPKLIEKKGAELFIGLSYSVSKVKVEFLRHELVDSDDVSLENEAEDINVNESLPTGLIHKYFDNSFIALTDVEEKWGKIYKARVLVTTKTENEMREKINELIDKKVETFMWGGFDLYTSYNYKKLSLPRPQTKRNA